MSKKNRKNGKMRRLRTSAELAALRENSTKESSASPLTGGLGMPR